MKFLGVPALAFLFLVSLGSAQQPQITSFGNGILTWSNSANSGYHSVEWASSLTGTWSATWQPLVDIPAVPGKTAQNVPMFYRVVWSSTAIASNATVTLPPNVSNFSATSGNGSIGLSWVTPYATNVVGVCILRSTAWFPSTPTAGTVVFYGLGNTVQDTLLSNGTMYYYTAFTYDSFANFSLGSTASATPADNTPPPTVLNFTATVGDQQVFLNWQNPISSDLAGVKVVRSTSGPPTGPLTGTQVYVGLGTNATDNGLVNGTTCYYKAYTFDQIPNYSIGVPALATPANILPPGEVSNVTAIPSNKQVVLNWVNPTGNGFLGVQIQSQTNTPPTSISGGMTIFRGAGQSFTNVNLVNGTTYFYRLFTYDEVPNYSVGVVTSATPADVVPPANVTGFTVAPVVGGISLSWGNPLDLDFAGVQIQRKTAGYPTNTTDGVTVYQGAGTNATDTPLPNAVTTNYYRIYSYDGVPNYASGVTGTLAPPPNVTAFKAMASNALVTLTWTNPIGSTFAGTQIQRKIGSAPTNATDGVTVYAGMATIFTNTGLGNLTTYYYGAFCYDATPNYSVGVTTNATPADVYPPGNITSLTASYSNQTVYLQWVNPTDSDFAGVQIQRKTSGNPTNASDGTTVYTGIGTNFTDIGLTNGTTYYYGVFSFDHVPNYASGVSTNVMPLRVAFVETFENAGGWVDHPVSAGTPWSQTASSGVWSASSGYLGATSSVANAHSGARYLFSAAPMNGSIYLPPVDNPIEIRFWARAQGYASSGSVQAYYFDGASWYSVGSSVGVSGSTYSQQVIRVNLSGRPAQQLYLNLNCNSSPLFVDDIEVRVAP